MAGASEPSGGSGPTSKTLLFMCAVRFSSTLTPRDVVHNILQSTIWQ